MSAIPVISTRTDLLTAWGPKPYPIRVIKPALHTQSHSAIQIQLSCLRFILAHCCVALSNCSQRRRSLFSRSLTHSLSLSLSRSHALSSSRAHHRSLSVTHVLLTRQSLLSLVLSRPLACALAHARSVSLFRARCLTLSSPRTSLRCFALRLLLCTNKLTAHPSLSLTCSITSLALTTHSLSPPHSCGSLATLLPTQRFTLPAFHSHPLFVSLCRSQRACQRILQLNTLPTCACGWFDFLNVTARCLSAGSGCLSLLFCYLLYFFSRLFARELWAVLFLFR